MPGIGSNTADCRTRPTSSGWHAPVAEPRPLVAIQTAVTRITRRGHRLGRDSLRISAAQALRAHTLEGAVSLGREAEFGSLEVGKRADFVVLGADPLVVAGKEIASVPVLETWVDGERRYAGERPEGEHREGLSSI